MFTARWISGCSLLNDAGCRVSGTFSVLVREERSLTSNTKSCAW